MSLTFVEGLSRLNTKVLFEKFEFSVFIASLNSSSDTILIFPSKSSLLNVYSAYLTAQGAFSKCLAYMDLVFCIAASHLFLFDFVGYSIFRMSGILN